MSRKLVIKLGGAFFGPREVSLLEEAMEAAWRILSSSGVRDEPSTRLILATGILAKARAGEREVDRLAHAACRHWVRNAAPRRAEALHPSFAVH